jgi:hypothetical protein
MRRADLILHPVRFRILETLLGESLTTQAIADRLPDVPKSTIYRHVKQLLESEMIAVDETHPVRGALEKTYRLNQSIRLGVEEMADMTPDEHIAYFRTYAMTLIQGFSSFVNGAAVDDKIDMLTHRAGYSEAFVFATATELDEAFSALNTLLMELAKNSSGEGRHKHKIAIITHPE